MNFWIYIHYQLAYKRLNVRELKEIFTFCICFKTRQPLKLTFLTLSFVLNVWNLPDICVQFTRLVDNWVYDRKFDCRYSFGFVDCLLELMWIRDRMLAAKNMNSNAQNIQWEKIDLKNKSHLKWLINWCKQKQTILLNIIYGTIQQQTINNESESVKKKISGGCYGSRVQIIALSMMSLCSLQLTNLSPTIPIQMFIFSFFMSSFGDKDLSMGC